ncbi:MAG: precorrin-6y C5,15-methyltransferase (decarboxylating) subunit CbiE [Flavonifractor plautii]
MDKAPRGPVGVLLSGDTGFYSGAKGLWPLLGNHEVITIPGISSLSYFCARLQTTWQDARLVSAHGRSHNAVGEIQRSAKVFALTGGATKAEDICRALAERGLGQVRVSVGERLSYADERIVTGTAAELAGRPCRPLRPAGGQPRSGGAAVERLRPARRGLSPGDAHDQGGARAGPVRCVWRRTMWCGTWGRAPARCRWSAPPVPPAGCTPWRRRRPWPCWRRTGPASPPAWRWWCTAPEA